MLVRGRDKSMSCCEWALVNEQMKNYHDEEWGVPVYDDTKLFELLILEGMQAGLSWATILSKRENMRQAFDQFNPNTIINYKEEKIDELLQNEGIIRHRLKLKSLSVNAAAFIEIQREFGSFSNYIWSFVDNAPIINAWENIEDVPSNNSLSDEISKDLKKRGFKFVGTTIVYSFLQAAGIINDHMIYCYAKKI